ncbi:acetolactate synthase small subunit [Lacrimispora amygdalina]|uniref:Acetolactate synthase small subunit n=1 Tax=Lacrimispora amygdalina TaxID=253257 RepID=A0A3E2ND28_9FIRM|nr:acetolactate synthase small subunit [Clostridium indicum]RFZ78929.1 acetolactate synthase small subunit [Clostridium indicum]
MKKRWLCLFVENEVGVLARITGLFSAKAYNLNSLTVGTTQDETASRVTISLFSDDQLFEQIKKQLNRMVEVFKVIDYTDIDIYRKEIMFLKILKCTENDRTFLFQFSEVYGIRILDFNKDSVLIESIKAEEENNLMLQLLYKRLDNPVEIVRGGSVAVEAV